MPGSLRASRPRSSRGRHASLLALVALGVAGCSTAAKVEKKHARRALGDSNDAPELAGVSGQLAAIASSSQPSLVRVLNQPHTFKRFDRWAEGLLGDLVGLFKVNPYYDYPYRILHVPLYLLFGEFDLGDSLGSGFVVSATPERVLAITNAHVVENAARLECELVDGRRAEAEVVKVDEGRDLALLRFELTGPLPPTLRLRRASGRPGEPVLAIGFPGRDVLTDDVLGFAKIDEVDERPNPTVTLGVLSAVEVELGNPEMRYLQTDAAINHGGSGGPLLDLKGQTVGVVEMIGLNSANEGYAIPATVVLETFASELGVAAETSAVTGSRS